MEPNELRDSLLEFAAVTEEEPFGPGVIVYKVLGKMYALCTYESPLKVNLKCDPERALELRNRYHAVKAGYHMNKRHWNTITIDGSIPREVLESLVRHSYDLVVKGMTKKDQAKVKQQSSKENESNKGWHEEFLRDISG